MFQIGLCVDIAGRRSATITSIAAFAKRLQATWSHEIISESFIDPTSSIFSSSRAPTVGLQLRFDSVAPPALTTREEPTPTACSSNIHVRSGFTAWRGLGFPSTSVQPCTPRPNLSAGGVLGAVRVRQVSPHGPSLEALLGQRRLKSTNGKVWRSGRAGGGEGSDRGDPVDGQQRRYRSRRRFGRSTKIMDTASLKELAVLAAREVAGWSAKELAAAARRTVSLWRRERPKGQNLSRPMQELSLPPPSFQPSSSPPQHHNVAAGSGADGGVADSRWAWAGVPQLRDGAGGGVATRLAGVAATQFDVAHQRRRARDRRSGSVADRGRVEGLCSGGDTVGLDAFGGGADGGLASHGAGGGGGRWPLRPLSGREGVAGAMPAEAVAGLPPPSTPSLRPPTATTGGRPPPKAPSDAVSRTVLVHRRLRPQERQLGDLVERLVRGARARLGEQAFGSRELATFLWSLTSLGYWQPPLLQLVSAFMDYRGERLRASNPIDVAVVLQVVAKARQAAEAPGSAAQSDTARRLMKLAPSAAAAAAAALPRQLPACESRTLAGLLHSCAVLLRPPRASKAAKTTTINLSAGGGTRETAGMSAASSNNSIRLATVTESMTRSWVYSNCAAEPARGSESGSELGPGSGFAPGSGSQAWEAAAPSDLAALARKVVRECVRRRFTGFGPVGLLTAAGALRALQPVLFDGESTSRRCLGLGPGPGPGGSAPAVVTANSADTSTSAAGAGASGGGPEGGYQGSPGACPGACPGAGSFAGELAEAWRQLEAAAVARVAPEMAGASPEQWRRLRKLVASQAQPSQQLLASIAAAAGGGNSSSRVAAVAAAAGGGSDSASSGGRAVAGNRGPA